MRKSLVVLSSFLALAVLTAAPAFGFGSGRPPAAEQPAADPAPELPPGAPIAVVNGQPVTKGEFDRAMRAYLNNFRGQGGPHGGVAEANAQMKSDVLDQLVDRELLYQASKGFPVENLDALVDAEFQRIEGQFPSPEKFAEAYRGEGLTEASLKDLLGRQLSVREYVEGQLANQVVVADAEVEAFYQENEAKFAVPAQVHCSHILIRVDDGASAEDKEAARTKAEAVRVRCVAGEDFGELAKELSEDPGSAPRGGDLGFFTRERMVTPFADAAFALGVGEVSEVVETQFGYHVIKLHERKDPAKRELPEVKDQIEAYLKSRALDGMVREKIAALRAEAKVEVVAPHL